MVTPSHEDLVYPKQKRAEKEERFTTNDKDGKDDQTKHSERDLYDLSMLQLKFKLSPEEEKHEHKIRKEHKPAYNLMANMTRMQDFYKKHLRYMIKNAF